MNDPRAPEHAPENLAMTELMVFHDVARALTSSLDLDAILGTIVQQMEKFFEPESWSLLMVDEKQNQLYYAVAAGQSGPVRGDVRSDIRIPRGEGIAGWVAQHGELLIVPDLSRDPRFHPVWDAPLSVTSSAGADGYAGGTDTPLNATPQLAASLPRSALCVPLRLQERTLGVIELLNYRTDTLTDYTLSFLQVLAEYAAIAIENARAMERIQELTITDDLTGLYNSRHLFGVLEREIDRSRRFRLPFGLVFVDLDHFKRINDTHGHLIGSRLLAEVAQTIKANIRTVDSAFRYGGDEFIVLLPQTSKDASIEVTLRLLEAMRQAHYLRAEDLNLTICASFGIASYPDDGATGHQIINAADAMMYLVKNSSRNNIAVAQRGFIPV